MKIREKIIGEVFTVYDVKRDQNGYPHFLIYSNGQWLYVSAKHYMPYREE